MANDPKSRRATAPEAIFPLTAIEEGVLYHSIDRVAGQPYLLQLLLEFSGQLQTDVFAEAWRKLVSRHAALRSQFIWERRGNPLRIVLQSAQTPISELDWRATSADERLARLEALLAADRQDFMRLDRAPLVRLVLVQREDAVWTAVISSHHLILDGWSWSVLIREFMSLYAAEAAGRRLDWPTPPSYRNYFRWLQQQDFADSESYWCRLLADVPGPPIWFRPGNVRRRDERPRADPIHRL